MGMQPTYLQRFAANWLVTDPSIRQEYAAPKNYQVQNHENIRYLFFLGGRLRFIKKMPINVMVGVAIVVPAVLFWVFEAKLVWDHHSPALVVLFSYFWALAFLFFITSSTSDAGILPRNVHLPVQVVDSRAREAPDEYFNTVMLPYDDKNGVSVKYCPTCHIWRPPRASHCSLCNTCAINHDHHCVFLNNCVAYRNYKYFLWFLLCTVISCGLLIAASFVLVRHDFRRAILRHPVSLLLAVYGCMAVCYPLLLLGFHVFLTANNITTREYLNYVYRQENKFVNVYEHGIWNNLCLNWIGKPRGPSLVRFRDDYDAKDVRFQRVEPWA